MKRILITIACVLTLLCSAYAEEKKSGNSRKDMVSYGIGASIGTNLKQSLKVKPSDVNYEMILKGIKDGLNNNNSMYSELELKTAMKSFQKEQMEKASSGNIKEGKAFLDANAKKKGVKTTASGLQYKVNKAGSGNTPKATDSVVVHYSGKLLDGTVFDSSYKRNQPATFNVSQLIQGMTEALMLMKEGGNWTVYIPSNIAYGTRGAPPLIAPGATLIFELELISIK